MAPAAYPYPGAAPQPPTPPKSSKKLVIALVGGIVGVLVLALVVWWFAFRPNSGSGPAPAPGPSSTTPKPKTTVAPQWQTLRVGGLTNGAIYVYTPIEGLAVFSSATDFPVTYYGVDLTSLQTLWNVNVSFYGKVLGDETGLVFSGPTDVLVLNPRTGETMAQFDSTQHPTNVIWAGQGYMVTPDTDYTDICVSRLSDPLRCVWTAPRVTVFDASAFSDYQDKAVFGGGKWINTGSGVKELATGDAATFGGDVSIGQGNDVYYTGTSPDRIFRVLPSADDMTASYQPWDTQNDVGISPAIYASAVITAADSSVYISLVADTSSNAGQGDFISTAQQWATGQSVWSQPTYFRSDSLFPQLVGDYYLQMGHLGNYINGYELIDATGNVKWQGDADVADQYDWSVGLYNGIYYIYNSHADYNHPTLSAYDEDSWQVLWTTQFPGDPQDQAYSTGYLLVYDSDGSISVLSL